MANNSVATLNNDRSPDILTSPMTKLFTRSFRLYPIFDEQEIGKPSSPNPSIFRFRQFDQKTESGIPAGRQKSKLLTSTAFGNKLLTSSDWILRVWRRLPHLGNTICSGGRDRRDRPTGYLNQLSRNLWSGLLVQKWSRWQNVSGQLSRQRRGASLHILIWHTFGPIPPVAWAARFSFVRVACGAQQVTRPQQLVVANKSRARAIRCCSGINLRENTETFRIFLTASSISSLARYDPICFLN